jgi:predicted RNase H-like HicB family nuclease
MRRTIQVRFFRGETKYVAECLDLPVVAEADTLDQLASYILEAIGLHLEGENLRDLRLAPDPTIVLAAG